MKTIENCTVIIITEEDKRKQQKEEWERFNDLCTLHAIEYAQEEACRIRHESAMEII
jgi:hypothetical protein